MYHWLTEYRAYNNVPREYASREITSLSEIQPAICCWQVGKNRERTDHDCVGRVADRILTCQALKHVRIRRWHVEGRLCDHMPRRALVPEVADRPHGVCDVQLFADVQVQELPSRPAW